MQVSWMGGIIMNTETIPSEGIYDYSISLVDSFNKQIKEAYEYEKNHAYKEYESKIISYRMEVE